MLLGISAAVAAAYLVLIIVDLTGTRLISKAGIYYPLMIISPGVAMGFIVVSMSTKVTGELELVTGGISSGFISNTAASVAALAAAFMAAYTYIKGQVAPVDKKALIHADYDASAIRLYSAKRLLITGFSGMLLCIAAAAVLFFFVYRFHELTLNDIISHLMIVVFGVLFALIFPLMWVFIIVAALLAGSVIVQFSIVGAAFFLFNLFAANGCIRCVMNSDKSKPMKVLFIILSLIPVFNIVYGIICLKGIAAELKQVSNC